MADGPDTSEQELFGASAPASSASSAPQVDPDTDAAVRTAYAEAGKDGWAAVANVIRNRRDLSGKPISAVVSDPNAFEGYGNAKYKSLKAGSQQYNSVLQAITPVLQGQQSPVGDADAYYSPTGQTAKKRSAPDWSNGREPVANVGGNVFYRGVYNGAAPAVDHASESELFGGSPAPNLPTGVPASNGPVTQSDLPAVEARPQKLEDSGAFMGYGGRGQPVFDDLGQGNHSVRYGNEPNRDLPSPDPNLPKPPAGYYWPEGVEMGADGKPRLDMAANDPNRVEKFDPNLSSDEMTAWRLGLTPSGQAALAQARGHLQGELSAGNELSGAVAQGVSQGTLPWLTGQAAYGGQAIVNGLNRLTGQPVTMSADDVRDAERLGTGMFLRNAAAQHPLATFGGSMLTAIPAAESGVGLLRAVPAVAEAAGAGEPVVNALTTGSRFATGEAGDGQGIGNLMLRTLSKGASGSIQGATSGAASTGLTDRSVADNALSGAEFGGALTGGSALAGGVGSGLVRSLYGAPSMGAGSRNLLQVAADNGIQLRAGQMSSNPALRYADSELGNMPFTGYAESSAQQRKAFTAAVAKTFGEDASGLTPEVMDRARTRIGQMFDDVASKTSIPNRDDVLSNLGGVVNEAQAVLPESELAPLRKQVENIATSFDDNGVMSGKAYQALTKRNGALDLAMRSPNPGIRQYAGQMRDVLDDALEANAKPEDLKTLQSARLQWKNMRTVQDLAEKAGPDGQISPALLKNAVRKSYKDYAYTGAGDIGDLAEIGQRFLSEPPNSGTAARIGVRNLLSGATLAGLGETAGALTHNPLLGTLALGTAGASQVAPAIGARVLNNPLTRSLFVEPSVPDWARYAGSALKIGSRPVLPLGVQGANMLLADRPAPQLVHQNGQ